MAWPTLMDYNVAVQNPRTAFQDVDLKAGKPECTQLGVPRVRSGQFACVYKLICGNKNWAIRCFSQEVNDQQLRYQEIDKYISPLNIPQMVGFDYLEKGIFVKGQWYPILRMEWVQGDMISSYIEKNLNNSLVLRKLTKSWVEVINTLQANSISHGDLQHGNVMVVNGDLKLVDYDGMFVPTLKGQLNREMGHPNYQHPRRNEHDFGLYIDNFSAWVFYVSLVALSIDPSLWKKMKAGDECLLFRKADFERPLLSQVFTTLTSHPDPNVRTIAMLFRSMLSFPASQVPTLEGRISEPQGLLSPPTQAGWWQDHKESTTLPSSKTAGLLTNKQSELPRASWVLDFINPQQRKYFNKSFSFLRLYSISSIITSLIIPFGIISLINFLDFSSLASSFGYLIFVMFFIIFFLTLTNGAIFFWKYSLDPFVIEKTKLLLDAKKVRQSSKEFEKGIQSIERIKKLIYADWGEKRNKFVTQQKQLTTQEQLEVGNIQSSLQDFANRINLAISQNKRNEDDSITKLNEIVGKKLVEAKGQISLLINAEKNEIATEILSVQNRYIAEYLQRHTISEAHIPGLGYSSRSTLEGALHSNGIYTARDINYNRVDAVYGFGPVRTRALVNWRAGLELMAKKNMPRSLNPNIEHSIHQKYSSQKKQWEIIRDIEQVNYNNQSKIIYDQSKVISQDLTNQLNAKQTDATQKILDIKQRFAQEYSKPTEQINRLDKEYNGKLHEEDQKIIQIRKKIFELNWQNATINHNISAYKRITVLHYFMIAYFGIRVK